MKKIFIYLATLLFVAACSSESPIFKENNDVTTPDAKSDFIEISDVEVDYDSGSHNKDLTILSSINPNRLTLYITCSTEDSSWIGCSLVDVVENADLTYLATYSLSIEARGEFSFSARNAAIQIYYCADDIAVGDSFSIMQSGAEIAPDVAVITGAANGKLGDQILALQESNTLSDDLGQYTKLLISGSAMNSSDFEAFKQFVNVTYLDISNTTTSTIIASKYKDDTILEQIILPSTLLKINSNAFKNSVITTITIPSSVTTWSANAFEECRSLESIYLSDGLSTMPALAFEGCDSLESVTSYSEIPPKIISDGGSCNPINATATQDVVVYVPSSSVAAYREAEGWRECKICAIQ